MDRNNLEFRGVSWGGGIVLKFVLKKYFGGVGVD
jgi:hypothetical protein